MKNLRRILAAEGLYSLPQLREIAQEYLQALNKARHPERWMRFVSASVEQWPGRNEINAFHGFIPRRFRHEDEDYGDGEDQGWTDFNAWEEHLWKVEKTLKRKYPKIDFSTSRKI